MSIRIDGTNTTANPGITGSDTDTGLQFGTNEVKVVTDGTAKATFDNSGNLLFTRESESSPHPEQEIKWSNDSTTSNGFYITQDSDRNGKIWHEQGLDVLVGTTDEERMRIDSNGHVGIGTTANSDSQLHVKSGANDGDPVLRLEAATNNFLNFRQTGSVYDIRVTAGDPLSFTIGSSEMARVTSNGLTFNGDTGAVNALDDYEEGTFTPTYLSGLSSPTYSDTTGTYTKIGNLVTFTLRINASGTNVGSHARIGSLPFTSSSGKDEGGASFGYAGNLPGNQEVDVYLYIPPNATNIEFYYTSGANFLGNGGNGLSGRTLHIRGFYYV